MTGSYNLWLVFLSYVVATLASYTALDLAGRANRADSARAKQWLLGGASAMALGIWSMHFTGMLAYRLPVAMNYDPTLTAFSFVMAIVPAAVSLRLIQRDHSYRRISFGALLLGSGVVGMHYTGMAAMQMEAGITYRPLLVAASVVIAYAASGAALTIFTALRRRSAHLKALRAVAAFVMGLAVTGMHYTGMAAARFQSMSMGGQGGINENWLALLVIVGTVCLLGVGLLTSTYDLRLETQTAKLVKSLAHANEELSFLAKHDTLTQLANRAGLLERLQAQQDQTALSLLFLDLDGFKKINDVYGHDVGDVVLATTARRLQGQIRTHDMAARLGGDEFVLLLEEIDKEGLSRFCERIIEAVEQPIDFAGQALRLSVSIGVTVHKGNSSERAEMLTCADTAMYKAKENGGGKYRFYEPSMQIGTREELQLLQELRSALDENKFELHYQPKCAVGNGGIIGVEALLRWRRNGLALVPPDQFIPQAEKAGLIVPIGYWVLNEACRQLAEWREQGRRLHMAVNLSALQLLDPQLVDRVESLLRTYDLRPGTLILELTESTAMQNSEVCIAILRRLEALGVGIAIDDFGTGYSNLLQLKRMPATELKIDRAFVRELVESNEDTAIITAIVALGKTLSLSIVAEGVETSAQKKQLEELGCSSLQGYLLGRPMPAKQLEEQMGLPVKGISKSRRLSGVFRTQTALVG